MCRPAACSPRRPPGGAIATFLTTLQACRRRPGPAPLTSQRSGSPFASRQPQHQIDPVGAGRGASRGSRYPRPCPTMNKMFSAQSGHRPSTARTVALIVFSITRSGYKHTGRNDKNTLSRRAGEGRSPSAVLSSTGHRSSPPNLLRRQLEWSTVASGGQVAPGKNPWQIEDCPTEGSTAPRRGTACPLRARSGGQQRYATVTHCRDERARRSSRAALSHAHRGQASSHADSEGSIPFTRSGQTWCHLPGGMVPLLRELPSKLA
jgi:hypothetical protein